MPTDAELDRAFKLCDASEARTLLESATNAVNLAIASIPHDPTGARVIAAVRPRFEREVGSDALVPNADGTIAFNPDDPLYLFYYARELQCRTRRVLKLRAIEAFLRGVVAGEKSENRLVEINAALHDKPEGPRCKCGDVHWCSVMEKKYEDMEKERDRLVAGFKTWPDASTADDDDDDDDSSS